MGIKDFQLEAPLSSELPPLGHHDGTGKVVSYKTGLLVPTQTQAIFLRPQYVCVTEYVLKIESETSILALLRRAGSESSLLLGVLEAERGCADTKKG